MKVAINKCFGGFCLSDKAVKRLLNLKDKECFFYKQTKWNFHDGIDEYSLIDGDDDDIFKHSVTRYLGEKINELPEEDYFYYGNLDRTDNDLIQVIEEFGDEASGKCGNIKIVDIPDDIQWEIDDYDGIETIHEVHRSW